MAGKSSDLIELVEGGEGGDLLLGLPEYLCKHGEIACKVIKPSQMTAEPLGRLIDDPCGNDDDDSSNGACNKLTSLMT